MATTAKAATVNQCVGTGPEPAFWPWPVSTGGTFSWTLTIDGEVTCASPLNVRLPFQLQLTCPLSVEGQCAGPLAFALSLGVVPCDGVAVQSGLDFTGNCVAASFNFDYLPSQWSMVVTVASP